jgi:hypothetical protein
MWLLCCSMLSESMCRCPGCDDGGGERQPRGVGADCSRP